MPSGRLDKFLIMPPQGLVGDGDVPSAHTDNRDIGRYVARIIADPRTLNRQVFAYGEVLAHNKIWDAVERASGETLRRDYIPAAQIEAGRAAAREAAAAPDADPRAVMAMAGAEYMYSIAVRGDNTPENAKYLGYLDAKELYPDFEPVKFDDFLAQVLDGSAKRAWADDPRFGGQ